MPPPRPGKQQQVRELRDKLEQLEDDERDRAMAELGTLEVDPFDHVTAPRIGIDDAATDWLRAQWRAAKPRPETWAALLERGHGQRVLELAPEQDGVPCAGSMSGPLDFRGQQLRFAEAIIDEQLVQEAWSITMPRRWSTTPRASTPRSPRIARSPPARSSRLSRVPRVG